MAAAHVHGHAAQAVGKTREELARARENLQRGLAAVSLDVGGSTESFFRAAWHLSAGALRAEMTAHTLLSCYDFLSSGDWRAQLQRLDIEHPGAPTEADPEGLMRAALERLFAIDRLMAALYDELRASAIEGLGDGALSDDVLSRLTRDWSREP